MIHLIYPNAIRGVPNALRAAKQNTLLSVMGTHHNNNHLKTKQNNLKDNMNLKMISKYFYFDFVMQAVSVSISAALT